MVTLLKNLGTADEPVVPLVSYTSDRMSACMLSNLSACPGEVLLKGAMVWRKEGEIDYGFRHFDAGFPHKSVSECLRRLVDASALPNAGGSHTPLDGEGPLLNALQAHGSVKRHGGEWRLTTLGAHNLEFRGRLCDPRALSEPRPLPIENLSSFELMSCLLSQGWTRRALPPLVAARRQLRFIITDPECPRAWYSIQLTVQRPYLVCLLMAQHLRTEHGVTLIPHFAGDVVFNAILQGTLLEEALALEDQGGNRRKRRRALQGLELDVAMDDGEDEILPGVLADGAEDPAADDRPMLGLGELSGNQADMLPDASLIPADLQPGEGDVGAIMEDGEHVRAPLALEGPVGVGGVEIPPGAVASASASRGPRGDGPGGASAPHIDEWASFVFSRKRPDNSPPFGAIQATCKFHALSHRTGCKKTLRLLSDGPDGEAHCLLALKHWCNQAKQFRHQRWHVRMTLDPGSIPPADVLEAQKLTDIPPPRVLTDKELDTGHTEADVAGHKAAPKAGAKRRAASKAKAAAPKPNSGKGSGRGKAKAKGKAPASSGSNGSSSDGGSSSSSSDSSSSSSQTTSSSSS